MGTQVRVVNGSRLRTFEAISDRIRVFSLTRNGPELDAETSELGPDRTPIKVGATAMDYFTRNDRQTVSGGA